MIERQIVEGKAAMVAYLNDKFEPVDKVTASLVKVIFDDGDVVFLTPAATGVIQDPSLRQE